MNANKNLLAGILLGALATWLTMYVSWSFFAGKASLLMKGISGIVILVLGLLTLFLWRKNVRKAGKNQDNAPGMIAGLPVYGWVFMTAFITLCGLVGSLMVFRQNKMFEALKEAQNTANERQAELVESVRINSSALLIGNVLNKVDEELNNNPGKALSESTIARIAAVNHSLKPYGKQQGDSLPKGKFSPEKGQLLMALSLMDMDSSSFQQIKNRTPFTHADLSGVNLYRADLRGVNLRWANLSGANLGKADLRGADLRDAYLWGANLAGANLSEADIQRADLSWSNLNGAHLVETDLSSANLAHATLKKANVTRGLIILSNMNGAFLNEGIFKGVNFTGTDLIKANLNNANLRNTYLKEVNLTDAVMIRADLSGAEFVKAELQGVEIQAQNWFEKLKALKVVGLEQVEEKFRISADSAGQAVFRVVRR